MDPLTVSLLLAGTGSSIAGGIFGRNDALDAAQRKAEARNAVLRENIAKQEAFYGQNKGVFDANMSGYAAPAQAQRLQTAQDTRSSANTANVTQVDPNSIATQADASPAVKSEIAKRMLSTFNQATDRAKAMGKLGGYGDAWLQNQLGNRQADRDIGVTNSFAEGRKAILGPEQDAAEAAAYRPPSIWPTILKGAGSIMSGAAGAGVFKGAGAAAGSTFMSPNNPWGFDQNPYG